MKQRLGTLLLTAGLALVTAACSSSAARVSQFNAFARAGAQFTDAYPQVLDDSFETTVKTSSLILIESRPHLAEENRLKAIERNDSLLRERIEILNDLGRHARMLGAYFMALQGLAQTDAQSSGLVDVANGLVDSLGELSPSIAEASIAGASVSDLVPAAVNLAVVSFQAKALEQELRRNAPTIERELALQQAALAALADAMQADLETQNEALIRDNVVLPYVEDANLPASWSQLRLEAFQQQLQLSSVDAASRAAETLRSSFVALVENRLDEASATALIQDINGFLTFVEAATGTK